MFEGYISPFAGEERKERDRNAAWNAVKADPATAALVAGLFLLANNDGRRSPGNLVGRAGADALTALGGMEETRRRQERYEQELALEQEEAERRRRFNDLRNELSRARYDFDQQKHLDDMRYRGQRLEEERARRAERAEREAAREKARAEKEAKKQAAAQERAARRNRQANAPRGMERPAPPVVPAPEKKPEKLPTLQFYPGGADGNFFLLPGLPHAEAPALPRGGEAASSAQPEALALRGREGVPGVQGPSAAGHFPGVAAAETVQPFGNGMPQAAKNAARLLADNELLRRYGGLNWS
ncbi:hypothetical protein [Mailhella massiliensis]|uniref:hypothetical protein n=1 Tax=Mailhella massiliensis TaxID=1903261 RepID=UPI00097CEDD9|nr:hypothetical protein [Mailhella massiliensis]